MKTQQQYERDVAYRLAASTIDVYCHQVASEQSEQLYFDLSSSVAEGKLHNDELAEAVHYLRSAGLLAAHPADVDLVQVLPLEERAEVPADRQFCKLFEPEGKRQILVVLDDADEGSGPEVKVSCKPDGFGVCSVGIGFKESDTAWDSAEKMLANFSEARAIAFADSIVKQLGEFSPKQPGPLGNGASQ